MPALEHTTRQLTLRNALDSGSQALSRRTLHDREHVVVPVIALIGDSVIAAQGSKGPEFVPAAQIQATLAHWNAEPLLSGHPTDGQSGGALHNLEAQQAGSVFNPRFEDGKLKLDAYLDPSLPQGEAEITRVEAGEQIEVSVGISTLLDVTPGRTAEGEDYVGSWTVIVPDHLAFLEAGTEGACSIEAGCGAPRAAATANIGIPIESRQGEDEPTPRDAVLAENLYAILGDALMTSEGGPNSFAYLDDFNEDANTVYYVLVRHSPTSGKQLSAKRYRRSYTLNATETVATLGDDRTEVVRMSTYKDVQEDTMPDTPNDTAERDAQRDQSATTTNTEATVESKDATADCSCSERSATGDAQSTGTPTEQATIPVSVDTAELEGVLAQFKQLASIITPDVIAHVQAQKADLEQKHAESVARLASGQSAFTEDQLKTKSYEELQQLETLAGTAPVSTAPARHATYAGSAANSQPAASEFVPLDPWGLNTKAAN